MMNGLPAGREQGTCWEFRGPAWRTTLLKVWEVVSAEEEDNAYWSSFDSFDDFMCSWLV